MTEFHLIPKDDVSKHTSSDKCTCSPKKEVSMSGNNIYVHSSFDNRESDSNIKQHAYTIRTVDTKS